MYLMNLNGPRQLKRQTDVKAAQKGFECATFLFSGGFLFFFLSLMNRTPDRRSVSLRLLCSQTASPAAQTPCFLPQKFFDKVTVQM